MNVAVRLRVRSGAGKLQSQIRRTRNRVVESREGGRRGHIHIMKIYSCSVWTVSREMPIFQRGIHFEICTGVPPTQGASPQRDLPRRKLEVRSQGVPMNLFLNCARGSRDGEFEILGYKSSAQGRRRECSTRHSVKGGVSIYTKRQIGRAAQGCYQRTPFFQIGGRHRNTHVGGLRQCTGSLDLGRGCR